jgi:transposase-like protein
MSIDITGSGTCPQCKSIYIAKSTSSDVHYFRCIECGYEWIEE